MKLSLCHNKMLSSFFKASLSLRFVEFNGVMVRFDGLDLMGGLYIVFFDLQCLM